MNGFNKYVLKQLLVGMIFITVGLTCVIWLTQSLRYVEMIVNRGLTAGTFIYFTILLLPKFLSIILPIATFAVVVFIYSKLITDRELVIMRGAGQSQTALAKPALILAMLVVMFGYLLNLYLLPQSYRMFRALQWDIRYSFSHILLQEGTFNTVSKGITVYVRERTKDGQLLGILVHDQRNEKKPFTILAERGA
jgi:lipopolysaccharide export system permease protein